LKKKDGCSANVLQEQGGRNLKKLQELAENYRTFCSTDEKLLQEIHSISRVCFGENLQRSFNHR